MLQQLSFDEFIELSHTAKRVAVFQEIETEKKTAMDVFQTLDRELSGGVILESGLQRQDSGRYSLLAFESIAKLQVKNQQVYQTIGLKTVTYPDQPLVRLRELISELSYVSRADKADFIGSAVGLMSYDAIRYFENIPDRHAQDELLPEIEFNFYRTTVTFDHEKEILLISVMTEVGNDPVQAYQQAQGKIAYLITKLKQAIVHDTHEFSAPQKEVLAEMEVSDEVFMQWVDRAKDYITQGDAFQIVLSRTFKKQYVSSPLNVYCALRQSNMSPYMFYLPMGDRVIVGASPEKLVSVQRGLVAVNPIAGTRPRTLESNEADVAAELLSEKKEIAEHMMLVDLARNDLGVVSIPGSVNVMELLKVKHYPHISHITSEVTGQLQDHNDAFDALVSAFPAGTLSGAPKIRAMQIIDELEASRRGLYGGAICCLDYEGNLDSCIAIRMAVLKDGIATVRTGAGIVYDSDPFAEAQETKQKAKAMLHALEMADAAVI